MATAPDNPPAEPTPQAGEGEFVCTATGEVRKIGTPLGGPEPKTNDQLLAEQQAEDEARAAAVVVVAKPVDPLT